MRGYMHFLQGPIKNAILPATRMSDQKSIAFLCHPYHRGGVTRWMADAAAAFAQKGYKVYFVAPEPTVTFLSGKGRETLLQLLQKNNALVTVISKKVGWEFEFGTQEYRAYVYRQLLVQLPAGTAVILSDDDTVWMAAAGLYKSYRLVGVLHADEPYYYNIAKKYARQIAVFACVSERVHKTIHELAPEIPSNVIYTIPCGINLPAARTGVQTNDTLRLIYVGRITEYQKRTGDLAKIAAELRTRNTQFHLHIIGDGTDLGKLKMAVQSAGLEPYVTFYGWLPQQEVYRHLSTADILLLTSDFEGTPIAMMEALAAGCGVVGTRVSGIEDYEYHTSAPACYAVYNAGDINAAADKIYALATVEPALRQASARKLAEGEFGMDICVARYEEAIGIVQGNYAPPTKAQMPLFARIYSRFLSVARYLKVSFVNKS